MILNTESLPNARKAISAAMAAHSVPGAALALLKGGKAAGTGFFGVKNAVTCEPVDEHTFFEAASLTKPVFAYTVLRLADEYHFDLHRPLVEYLDAPPAGDPRFRKATAAHVLSHGTGLPNWGVNNHALPLAFAPGEGFSYSGSGYSYLQRVVEKLTGLRLDELMQRYVFNPFNMEHSSMLWTGAMNLLIASAHDETGKPEPLRHSALHPSGMEPNAAFSLYTCIDEYSLFLKKLIELGVAVPTSTVRNYVSSSVCWGLGWGIYEDVFFHWGDNGGYKSFACWDAGTGDAFVMHTNGFNGLSVCFTAVSALSGMDFAGVRSFIASVE